MSPTLRSRLLRRAGAALLSGVLSVVLSVVLSGLMAPAALAQGLTVAADSSLAEALNVLARDFEAAHPGHRVKLLLGASGALLEKIASDTPADLLISADAETAALGVQRRVLVPELRGAIASNTLVLVVPLSLSLPVQRLSDLALPEVQRIAMGREATVPAGRYAREAINAQRLWPSLQRKMVIAADVGEVLALVAGADVEAGFVFATDAARAGGRVRVLETLPTSTPIRYQANGVAGALHSAQAQAFITYLRSDAARVVFKRFGFGLP